jgi:hypothetical protein
MPGGSLSIVDIVAPDAATIPGRCAEELRQWAWLFNAFKKLPDPSHVRCLGLTRHGFSPFNKSQRRTAHNAMLCLYFIPISHYTVYHCISAHNRVRSQPNVTYGGL